ncbi:MAG: hypothetical protein ACRDJV_12905 [Actinomycetota bacterium]
MPSLLRSVVGAAVVTFVFAACFGATSESEAGAPDVAIDFPATSSPGSVQTMTLTVTNPGPEPMSTVLVTFTRVGMDMPIVDGALGGDNPAVASVDPEPLRVDEAAVVYHFDGLAEEESATISFRLRVPQERGVAANSVQVSDGAAPDHVRGVRLETEVTG